jgi:hypothetical protein
MMAINGNLLVINRPLVKAHVTLFGDFNTDMDGENQFPQILAKKG